ncbi:MAG: hypothetical protein J6T41_05740 [Neisseriaceae bacterium]|nr:hypothetical protein [Neisseriaceae bacterium]
MSLGKDIIDIYTKSSVYYLRLQYLVVCYLIVLAAAFFILPLPREMGINGNARLIVGGLLYIGFAVLLVYAPKLLYPLIGKLLSPYKDEKEVQEKFNQLSEKDKRELKKELKAEYGNEDFTIMNKKQRISTNLFFQCLLIELFCLVVLINNDQSLLISNSLTQNIADILKVYTDSIPPKYNDNFFTVGADIITGEEFSGDMPFSKYEYMSESIFFIYIVFIILLIIRVSTIFIFSRPILEREDFFSIIKNAKTIKKFIWALLGTIIFLIVAIGLTWMISMDLAFFIVQITDLGKWIKYSIGWFSFATLWLAISWRFIEDWYKKIFRKF